MKKFEFSKIITLVIIAIFAIYGVWAGCEYYHLCKFAIVNGGEMPDAILAVTCVTTILGAVLSYCLYQWGLKNSRNKYGINDEGQPFKMKNDIDDDDCFPEQDTFEEIDDDLIVEEEEEA